MPWRQADPILNATASSPMRRRIASFAKLCTHYGISRKTGYKWFRRAETAGSAHLAERSRRPWTCPHATRSGMCTLDPSSSGGLTSGSSGRGCLRPPSSTSCEGVTHVHGLICYPSARPFTPHFSACENSMTTADALDRAESPRLSVPHQGLRRLR